MCLIITFIAFLVSSLLYFKAPKLHNKTFEILPIAYLGASLMWCVDGFFNLYNNDPFLDMEPQEMLLGFIIVFVGIALLGLTAAYRAVFKKRT